MSRRFADGSAATENRPAARERRAGFLLQERFPFAGAASFYGRRRADAPPLPRRRVEGGGDRDCSALRPCRSRPLILETVRRAGEARRLPFAGAASFCGRRRAAAPPPPRRRVEGGGDRDCSALRPCRSRSAYTGNRPPCGRGAPASFCRSGFLYRSGFLLQERFPFAGDGERTRLRCPAVAPNGRRTPPARPDL